MTFEIYKLEWILSRHTFGNTTRLANSSENSSASRLRNIEEAQNVSKSNQGVMELRS